MKNNNPTPDQIAEQFKEFLLRQSKSNKTVFTQIIEKYDNNEIDVSDIKYFFFGDKGRELPDKMLVNMIASNYRCLYDYFDYKGYNIFLKLGENNKYYITSNDNIHYNNRIEAEQAAFINALLTINKR